MARRQESARGSMPLSELLNSTESRAMASFGVRDLDTMLRFAPRRYVVPARCAPCARSTRGRRSARSSR